MNGIQLARLNAWALELEHITGLDSLTVESKKPRSGDHGPCLENAPHRSDKGNPSQLEGGSKERRAQRPEMASKPFAEGGFAIVPAEFRNSLPTVKPSAASVYLTLLFYKDNVNHTCYPSIARIARETGLNRKTVMFALKDLVSKGLITITKRKDKNNPKLNDTNLYTLHAVHQKGVVPKTPRGSPKSGIVTRPNELINTTNQKSSITKVQPITAAVPKAKPSASSKSNLKPWEKQRNEADEAARKYDDARSAAAQKWADDNAQELAAQDPTAPTPGFDAIMARYHKQKAQTS